LLLGNEDIIQSPGFYFSKYANQAGILTLRYDNPLDPNTYEPVPVIKEYLPDFNPELISTAFYSLFKLLFNNSNIEVSSKGLNSEGEWEWSFSFSSSYKYITIEHNNLGDKIDLKIYLDPRKEINVINNQEASKLISKLMSIIDGIDRHYKFKDFNRRDISEDWGSPCDIVEIQFERMIK